MTLSEPAGPHPGGTTGDPDPLPRILIVDDDADLLQILKEVLRPNAQIRTALSGREGLDLDRQFAPEIVLLDLMLPEIDGREILRRIHARNPLTQIVIITGQGNETVAAECMKEGASDYIVKPFESRRVLEAVAHARSERARRLRILSEEERLRREYALLSEDKIALEVQTGELEKRVQERTRDLEGKNRTLETVNRSLISLNEILVRQNQTLTDLKRSYEELFENAADGFLKTNAAGRILLANRQAQALYGCTLSDLCSRNAVDLLPDAARGEFLRGLRSVAARERASFRMEADLHPVSGETILAEFRVAPLMREGAEQYLEIHIENVTQRRLDEVRLRKLEERAIVAGMSRHLSHVLRNSLTSAGGFLATVARETGLTPRGRDAVGVILREIRKMEEVVGGYQDYVETTKARPTERCDLNALVATVIAELSVPTAGGLNFAQIDIPREPAIALLDRRIYLLGMDNLFRGLVLVYTGNIPVSLHLQAGVEEGREHRLRITSPGVHLTPDLLQIMDRPWRHQVLHQTFDFWNMAIAQTMFDRHGGSLVVEDAPEGTAILGRLPLIP